MMYKFHACGHPNILGMHKTTLEFTKDKEVTLEGDCIIGVNADFELEKIRQFINKSENKKIIITMEAINNKKIKEKINAELNPDFGDNKEIVIRKTDFVSERTLATSSNKASFELNRDLLAYLKEKKNKIAVTIENKGK
ncbi:DUF371 domain-containing protein [Candidatus Woesearchaeota archaeon]|nr:DUF371 domain-containing protein [Candidatus Woesearchaeota archaeon]